ncbi:MAG: tryptophan-rich sensory protein [Aphanothece sp. CMT-3BRIN-NPC111]|jgi:hypothetical protein|nr:tryptophan-rich sensory protein [Aphanothece sp. CMT-3BRIN-NPC111]
MKSSAGRFDFDLIRQWLNLIAIIAAFAINIYANINPPNGLTIGDISNQFFSKVLIIPANYAFAIWGLIYLGLISFGIYQVLPAQRQNFSLRRGSYLLVLASIAQIAWIFLFVNRLFTLSLVAMLLILLPLIGIYLRLGIGRERVSKKELWLVHNPLSIYLAWISVATIVNVASALYDLGWSGWGINPQVWTVIMLIVGSAIAAVVTTTRTDIAYPLVIIWAIVAIAVRQIAQPLIAVTAGGLAIALGLLVLLSLRRRLQT